MDLFKKENNLKEVTLITAVLFYISILCIDAHIDGFSIFNSLLLTLFLVIMMFVVYQLSKLLFYAKREYSLIVGGVYDFRINFNFYFRINLLVCQRFGL